MVMGMTSGFENDPPRPIRRQVGTEVLSELETNSSLGGEASDQAYYKRRRLLQKFVQVEKLMPDRTDEKYDIVAVELFMAEGRFDVQKFEDKRPP